MPQPQRLARLRMDLDFMPSPVEDRPGLLVRDPYHYSDVTLIIPPALVQCMQFFDGEATDQDVRNALVQLTGDLRAGQAADDLIAALHESGFLIDDVYDRMRRERHAEFAGAPERLPVHAGSAYPDDASALSATLLEYMGDGERLVETDSLIGIAAPHVSPDGGWECYRAAYRALGPQYRDRTFVILGTSHYGQPEKFGLTRKSFITPFGEARTDQTLVDELSAAAESAVSMEDYCHAVEHSIEFQVVFLQHIFGPDIRILPILCGAFAKSIYVGGKPEDDPGVQRFLGALGELAARESNRLLWVLGVDMAHMGRRYGDEFAAMADQGPMTEVAEQDRARIERINAGDADGFWAAIQQNRDSLKWCGSSPFYTFMRAAPQARGELLRYRQWNIDEQSVVTFAGMAFRG